MGSVVVGELALLSSLEPVEQVLAGDRLSDEQKERLRFLMDVRRYAIEVVGLNVGGTYTMFFDTGDEPLAYNVSACPKDSFAPLVWHIPIAGSFEYLGFFDANQAERFRDALIEAGYDIFFYEVDAYSTASFIEDPIYSTMLNRDEIGIAELVFHELTHNTVFRVNDTQFNESVATFVGRTAAVRFLQEHFGPGSDLAEQALLRFADEDLFTEFIDRLYAALDEYYRTDLPLEQKIIGREGVIDEMQELFVEDYLPLMSNPEMYGGVAAAQINNAAILSYRRYHKDFEVFERVYDAVGESFRELLQVLSQASQSSDPYAYLNQWLDEN
jgi:predicted aminopeptidase